MLLLLSIPIGLVAGYLTGGRFSRLVHRHFRWTFLIPIAVLIQFLIFPWFFRAPLFPYATSALHLLSYVLVGVWLAANLRFRPMVVIGVGALCNLAVIAANGGRMPASEAALRAAGAFVEADALVEGGTVANVILMSETTRLNWLGDILHVPSWMPFATAFSIGDAILFLGLVWLIAKGMKDEGKESQ